MTVAEFKAAFPEFENAPTATVEAELEIAESLRPESVWTDETRRARAIGLTVAQVLAQKPNARDMQLSSDGVTVYDKRLDELIAIQAGGPRTI